MLIRGIRKLQIEYKVTKIGPARLASSHRLNLLKAAMILRVLVFDAPSVSPRSDADGISLSTWAIAVYISRSERITPNGQKLTDMNRM